MKSITIILVFGLIKLYTAVDKSVFKTCDQSSFCRRCRYQNSSNFVVLSETLTYLDSTYIAVEIRNKENDHLFLLKLRALEDNSFHFEINEKTPLMPRYRVTESLYQNPQYAVIDVTISKNTITIYSKANKAIVNISPFRLAFYRNEVLAVSFNAQNLLRFEHYRIKPINPDPTEEPGTWEESFGIFNDTKPNGPEAVALDVTFHNSEVLFGIPEHADSFALKVTVGTDDPYRLYNLDVGNYEVNSRMALYGSIPVIYGHGNGSTSGIFWHNTAETFVDIHSMETAHFMSEAGIIDVFVLLGPSPNEAFSQYTKLTGVANLPQMFSLAHHQSRWNYFTQDDVLEVVRNFDINDFPLDTMWLDIEYTDDKMYFTWNHTAFPNPIEMMNELRSTDGGGRHLTYIIDPHIKVQSSYQYYIDNSNRGYFVKDKDGNDFVGICWPGSSSYVDYFNPAARRFYADQYLLNNFAENAEDTGLWNDMNEPSVFDGPEVTMTKDNIHYEGWEHRQIHNAYGLMHVKGTFDGLMRRANGKFILSRSFFGGTQRYAAIWTGDNLSHWEHLQNSIKMCLSVSVAGISFCGSDIGGFFGDPEVELLVRWYQAAIYQPFHRAHANMDTQRREPYLLQEPARSAVREALKTRYALLPLWYTMFYEHERYGKPVMRPMLAEYPLDRNVFRLDNQYMLADRILVRPVLEKGVTSVNVYFPSLDGSGLSDLWYDFDTYIKVDSAGIKRIEVDSLKVPVFQKGGSIIPKKEIARRSSTYMTNDPVSLFIAVDIEKKAEGTLYIDDEKSYDYRRGKYIYLQFEFSDNSLTSRYIDKEASFLSESTLGRIMIAGLDQVPSYVTIEVLNGESQRLEVSRLAEEYFEIQVSNISLTLEWKITFNGATKNVICTSLFLLTIFVHFIQK